MKNTKLVNQQEKNQLFAKFRYWKKYSTAHYLLFTTWL